VNVLLWAAAGFAVIEGVAVATAGVDVFYAQPIPAQDRPLPALEWLAGAALLGIAAARTPAALPTSGGGY